MTLGSTNTSRGSLKLWRIRHLQRSGSDGFEYYKKNPHKRVFIAKVSKSIDFANFSASNKPMIALWEKKV